MAIIKSAKKAIRQNLRRKKRNFVYKEKMKELVKKARILVNEKKFDEAKKILPQVYKALDKAAKVGVIKNNAASRTKSRITRLTEKSQK